MAGSGCDLNEAHVGPGESAALGETREEEAGVVEKRSRHRASVRIRP
jgi:hypothetical protein